MYFNIHVFIGDVVPSNDHAQLAIYNKNKITFPKNESWKIERDLRVKTVTLQHG